MRQNNSHPVGPKLKQNPSDRAMNLNTEAQLLCPSAESAGPDLFTVKIYFSLPVNCLKKVRLSESSQSEMITGKIFALYF